MAPRPEPDGIDAATIDRRTLLAGLGAAAIGATAPRALTRPPRGIAGEGPRIAIIGAGLAGLTCAYRLLQLGILSTVYEARDDRVGGRCWTARGFAAAQTAEHGGEFIDTAHHRIRGLAAELSLTLDDVRAIGRHHHRQSERLFFDGAQRSHEQVYRHSHLLNARARRDARRIGSWRWDRAGAAARAMDEMTGAEWLDAALPNPEDHLLKLASRQYLSEEYGLDVDRLSAINLVWEYGPGPSSDERFHVHGGNDQIPHRIAHRLPSGSVRLDHPLRSLRRRGGSSYTLTFKGHPGEVVADLVVLCLPFPALRTVDLEGAGLSARKRRCIDELGMGTNAKLLIQFEEHLGHYDRFNGEYYDEHIDTWNSSLGQAGRPGLLTVYSGGRHGAGYSAAHPHAPAPPSVVRRTTATISRAVPGLAEGYDGRSWLDHWASDPWTHGSYAAFLPGQFTRYWGFIGQPEHGLHFAGEHTAMASLGYLEGAVRTGERAAREVGRKVAGG